jgi:ssDNA-binding replication factor A large subunit
MSARSLAHRVDPALAPHFAKLAGKMSEEEFLARIRAARAEFGDLLDDEALALLVLDELGFNEGAFATLDDLAGRGEATVRAVVARLDAPRTFQREGRPEGRVCNVLVRDATGEARVVLWDRDVDKTLDGTLREGARVTLVNARVKETRFGLELHVGPWTVLEVEGAPDAAKRKLLADVQQEPEPPKTVERIEGVLRQLHATRAQPRAEGGVEFLADADVETPEGRRVRVTLHDECVRQARALPPGARVAIDALETRVRGTADELHTTARSRVAPA